MADSSNDWAPRTVTRAEQLVSSGKVRRGLGELDDAAYNIQETDPTWQELFERVRAAASVAAQAEGGKYAEKAAEVIQVATQR